MGTQFLDNSLSWLLNASAVSGNMEILCLMIIMVLKNDNALSIPLVVPEDVPAGFAAIFGFSPRIFKANDHRFGFGFRLGNHADFQVLYEFGPQTITKPLQPVSRTRSPTYRQHLSRRRPILDFLLRAGILQESSYKFDVIHKCNDERR